MTRFSTCPRLSSVGQADLGPAVLPVGPGLREPELHRSGPEEVHLGAAVQAADSGLSR